MALELTKKKGYLLVDFAYGADYATHARYTNYSATVSFDGNDYAPLRTMAVELPTHGGGTDSAACKIEMPLDAFTSRLSDGLPHSPTKITIRQFFGKLGIDSRAAADVTLFAFRGEVRRFFRNINGRSDAVRFECLDAKAALSNPIGLPMLPTCQWTFAGSVCGVVPSSGLILTRTITEIDGTKVTFSDITDQGAPFGDRYTRGYVELDGLRIDIRKYTRGDDFVYLVETPPAAWVGAAGLIFPGCTKLEGVLGADCTYWNNVARNGATGVKSPDYQPMFEDPQ